MGTLTRFCITAFAKITSTGTLFISDRALSLFAQTQWEHLCNTRHSEIMCIKNWPAVSHEPLMRFNI